MPWYFDNDRSIYIQLVEQIQNRIFMGVYAPGSRIASVRELAGEAKVNPNTMQRALTELERIGLLYTQRTSGRYVTDDRVRIFEMKKRAAMETVRLFLKQMESLGFQREEIIALIGEVKEERET